MEKRRIRLVYEPLNIAVSVSGSVTTQTYDGAYHPDRTVTPGVFRPVISAQSSDGTAEVTLSDKVWSVDGIQIASHADFTGAYTVAEDGALTLRKNVPAGKSYTLRFSAVVKDTRTGNTVNVSTDDIVVTTQSKSGVTYSISIGDDQVIRYNPFLDRLHLYEYKVAHGLAEYSEETAASLVNGNAYRRKIPVTVFAGAASIGTGFTVRLYRVATDGELKELSDTDEEVVSISNDAVTLDLRMITKGDFVVKADFGISSSPAVQFSVNRIYEDYTIRPTNGASIMPGDTELLDTALVTTKGRVIECPESVIRIVWKTDSAALAGCTHNEGGRGYINLDKTKIGSERGEDWLVIYTESEIKGQYNVASDDGDTLVDNEGNILIFN